MSDGFLPIREVAGSNSYRLSHRETGREYVLNAQKLPLQIGSCANL
jgi:hypothetical protein